MDGTELAFDIFLGVVVVIVVIAIWGAIVWTKRDSKAQEWAQTSGYDVGDVHVWLKMTGGTFQDFKDSKSLRLQYGLFQGGEVTQFQTNAIAHKRSEDAKNAARSAGTTAGIVAGVTAGTIAGSSR